jgi:hypothetical protein
MGLSTRFYVLSGSVKGAFTIAPTTDGDLTTEGIGTYTNASIP